MQVLGANFYKLNGPDATSNYKISFMVDESQRKALLNLASNMEKGADVILIVHQGDDDAELKALVNESPEERRKVLSRKMHAIINEIADKYDKDSKEVKDTLKTYLKRKGYLEESTKELDEEGYAQAMFYLKHYIEYDG
ncbi:MAG: hypothetical protein ACOCTT_03735 [archaeon]